MQSVRTNFLDQLPSLPILVTDLRPFTNSNGTLGNAATPVLSSPAPYESAFRLARKAL